LNQYRGKFSDIQDLVISHAAARGNEKVLEAVLSRYDRRFPHNFQDDLERAASFGDLGMAVKLLSVSQVDSSFNNNALLRHTVEY
jgi:hypothetical protein